MMEELLNEVKYLPTPTSKLFHESTKQIRFIAGSVGNGKTTATLFDMFGHMINQRSFNNIRKSRWLIVRATYPELESIIVAEMKNWFPSSIMTIKLKKPILAIFDFELPDGTFVYAEVNMIGLDRPESAAKLRSWNGTAAWLNEADTLHKEVFDIVQQRVRRYPNPDSGGFNWGGVIGDYNPPDIRHWLYTTFVKNEVRSMDGKAISEVFHMKPAMYRVEDEQAGGFFYNGWSYFENPEGEGIDFQNDGIEYWFNQIDGKNDRYIRRYLMGEYVPTMDGKPVFNTFIEDEHVSKKPLKFIEGRPVLLAFDWGVHTAVLVTQVDAESRLLVLRELYDGDMGLSNLLETLLRPLLESELRNFEIRAIGDPSGGRDGVTIDLTPFRIVNEFFKEHGFDDTYCTKALTNAWIPRKEAVDYVLKKRNGALIDPSCEILIEGLAGNYLYAHKRGEFATYKDEPEKNLYSHIADDFQYICLDYKHIGGSFENSRPMNKNRKSRQAFGRRR